jgi:hypothetical protein
MQMYQIGILIKVAFFTHNEIINFLRQVFVLENLMVLFSQVG